MAALDGSLSLDRALAIESIVHGTWPEQLPQLAGSRSSSEVQKNLGEV